MSIFFSIVNIYFFNIITLYNSSANTAINNITYKKTVAGLINLERNSKSSDDSMLPWLDCSDKV